MDGPSGGDLKRLNHVAIAVPDLDAAAALPDNPRARQRGVTYRCLFALCCGLGLRVGEACGLRLRDFACTLDVQPGALEVELGVELFARVGRGIALTEAGRVLRPEAERVLAGVEQARDVGARRCGRCAGPAGG